MQNIPKIEPIKVKEYETTQPKSEWGLVFQCVPLF